MNNVKQTVISFYLDWVNCWLTPEAMAAFYSMTEDQCKQLIDLGRQWHEDSRK